MLVVLVMEYLVRWARSPRSPPHSPGLLFTKASEEGVANSNLHVSGQHALNLLLLLMHRYKISQPLYMNSTSSFKIFLKRATEESSLSKKYPVIRLFRRPDWVLLCTMIQVLRYLRVSQTTGSQEITTWLRLGRQQTVCTMCACLQLRSAIHRVWFHLQFPLPQTGHSGFLKK